MDQLETKFINEEQLPLVVEPKDKGISFENFLQLIKDNNAELKKDLLKYGGILFRNFPVKSAHDFDTVITAFGAGPFVNYIGGDSPRNKVTENVYTSTEAPPSIKLPLHNELSYVKKSPKHIYFYCEIPPLKDGQTIISDARKVMKAIKPEITSKLKEKGIKYISNYYCKSLLIDTLNKYQRSHKSWMEVFEATDKKEVERKCSEANYSYKWNKKDWIEVSQTLPPTTVHPITKDEVWFNQAHIFDFSPKMLGLWRYVGAKLLYSRKHTLLHDVFYGDGTRIPRKDLYHIMDKLDQHTIYFSWQKGDVLILDNLLTMHGRATFKGKRRVLTALTE